MLSQTLQDAINEQINKELYSEYLYLSMAAYLDAMGLPGMANFMKVQGEEERFHAMKFYDFINDRGGRVVLKAIEQPEVEFENVLDVFEKEMTMLPRVCSIGLWTSRWKKKTHLIIW